MGKELLAVFPREAECADVDDTNPRHDISNG